MAVYTEVPAETLAAFLAGFETGRLVSAKGIAEGVSNSNFLVETTTDRYILTLYERRIDTADLPFFIALMEHLADAGLPVPRPIHDRAGRALHQLAGRSACLIQFLPGVSVGAPTERQAEAAARALAGLHLAGQGFPRQRANHLSLGWWRATADLLGPGLDRIEPGLRDLVGAALGRIAAGWPSGLPAGIIHADLFPDNVLMLGDAVSGLIDFYFACTDLLAYDLAVLLAAWTFPPDGTAPFPGHVAAMLSGYEAVRPLSAAERAALPILGQGAALRFLLSRAQDWLAPAGDAALGAHGVLVQRKDPLPFANRLRYYAGLHAA